MTETLKYDILYLDPPWKYRDNKGNDPALGGKQYAMMSDTELADIPFKDIASKDALMFCWLVMPKLLEGLRLMQHWGFEPVTCGFVWVKLNKSSNGAVQMMLPDATYQHGTFLDHGVYSGLGSYTCGNAELCYIGKRGKGLKRCSKSVKQIMFEPLAAHSAKPAEAMKRIDTIYPPPYARIEFFSRREPVGLHWDATGFDYDGMDVSEFIRANQ